MKRIAEFEEIIERVNAGEKVEFTEYPDAKEKGLDEIDFNEVIWGKDIEGIVNQLRKAGHETFTISSTFSSLLETIWEFEQHGCRMEGLKQVRQGYDNFNEETMKMEPAYKPAAIIRL